MTAKVLTCIFVGVLRGQSSRSESSELRGLPCNEWRCNEKKWPKIWSGNKKVLLLHHCPLFAGDLRGLTLGESSRAAVSNKRSLT